MGNLLIMFILSFAICGKYNANIMDILEQELSQLEPGQSFKFMPDNPYVRNDPEHKMVRQVCGKLKLVYKPFKNDQGKGAEVLNP